MNFARIVKLLIMQAYYPRDVRNNTVS